MQQASDILRSVFGFDQFRTDQEAIIQTLLDGKDAFVLKPTGGGKSLCYQIPALLRQGTAIVVSPLIALMEDQVTALSELGVSAAFLNSSLDPATQQNIENELLDGKYDLLYVAPERLLTSRLLGLLRQIEISLFALDEAHCVSQWGHDFRKEYQRLSIIHEKFPGVPRVALTATADERTRQEIIDQLDLKVAQTFISSFDRPNIRYHVSEAQNSLDQLWRFIKTEHDQDAGIVYCLSRKRVEQVAEFLQKKGRVALAYHAGMPVEERRCNQQRFLREEGVIVVATIAFGMGIDKPDVRFVAHLNLPKNIESYYQETGRAGRDGKPANAWMAYGLQDVITLRQMMQESDAHSDYKRIQHHKLESMLAFCELTSCRRQNLLSYFSETLAEPCGNCDICLSPPETWDATVAAQKALSCIYRTGQTFGVTYVIDVLLGKDNERIQQNRHHTLSTFGLGKEFSVAEWRSVFRQLIAHGFVNVDMERYGALRLAEKSRAVLKSETKLHLRKYKKEKLEKQSKGKSNLRSYELALLEKLKALRSKLADFYSVPPYVIFHDSSLEEMARRRPQSEQGFRGISGVGDSKLKKYGSEFLALIKGQALPDILNNNLPDTINETLYLFNQGLDVNAIANKRNLSLSTVYTHMAEVLEAGLLDLEDVLTDLSQSEIVHIRHEMDILQTLELGKLKPVYEALGAEYDYGVLKCVLACL